MVGVKVALANLRNQPLNVLNQAITTSSEFKIDTGDDASHRYILLTTLRVFLRARVFVVDATYHILHCFRVWTHRNRIRYSYAYTYKILRHLRALRRWRRAGSIAAKQPCRQSAVIVDVSGWTEVRARRVSEPHNVLTRVCIIAPAPCCARAWHAEWGTVSTHSPLPVTTPCGEISLWILSPAACP
jgi:hypothetical protein